jgi:MFS family permease
MSRVFPVALLALALFTVTFAVNLQAPLYDVNAAGPELGATAVTVAFAAYFGGLMPTLLLLGGLSDRIGRRAPIALALILGTLATALLLRLPVFTAGTWMFGAAMALAWSTIGMTIAVVPLELAANDLGGWTGLVIFLAMFVGFLCQPFARRMTKDRGRVTAGLFVYVYVGFSLPVIASGALAERLGLLAAMVVFAVVQSAMTGLIVTLWHRRSDPLGQPQKRVEIR